jgi:hypothetical protein
VRFLRLGNKDGQIKRDFQGRFIARVASKPKLTGPRNKTGKLNLESLTFMMHSFQPRCFQPQSRPSTHSVPSRSTDVKQIG